MTKNLHGEIESALDHHELVKLRIPALDKTTRRELAAQICVDHHAILVEAIGGIIVIYRRNSETDRFAAPIGA